MPADRPRSISQPSGQNVLPLRTLRLTISHMSWAFRIFPLPYLFLLAICFSPFAFRFLLFAFTFGHWHIGSLTIGSLTIGHWLIVLSSISHA